MSPCTIAAVPAHQHTRKLMAPERADYDSNGLVVVEGIFRPNELDRIDREISRIRRESEENDPNFILKLGLRSPLTQAICQDERVLKLIEDLVQPGIAIYSAKLVEKAPDDTTVCHWHQDDAYYTQNSTSTCRMSVWIPLQDCDEHNGCLWVVPGSHRLGLQQWEKRSDGICNLAFRDGAEDIPGAVPCRIRAGSVLLFSALTWHRSLGNGTSRTRRSFIISYQEATAVRGNGEQHKILRPAPRPHDGSEESRHVF